MSLPDEQRVPLPQERPPSSTGGPTTGVHERTGRLRHYTRIQDGINEVVRQIRNIVAASNHHCFIGAREPHIMLTRLMRKLKPNEIEERYKTLQELTKHCSGPPVNESKSKWLNKWPEIISVYKAANLPDVEGALRVGNSEVASIGRGDVEVRSTRADGSTGRITLQNAVYVPDLHTNIISMDLANEVGVYLNQRLKILENGDGIPICRYFKLFKHNVVDYNKINVRDAERHASLEAVNQLENTATGAGVTPSENPICATCKLSNTRQQISRRPAERAAIVFEKVYFDLIHEETAFNGHKWVSH
ncbi:hypothetical protein BDV29DRAFT_151937 [Aspergillus leporis]|uniref:Retrovirus-related Pol polyprotein from transposon TNT 1-94-like beta-barrel domain-containing protein n=1 Tax=Aspergillus leporis TaxID=41062 RepID=A0A5N5XF25_9EURO|nr:hypothetical protein BDV29DRAFT_151937 [Aspergillus leporis]